uniref:Extracellular lipase (EC) n=1 Tax=Ganoderma boninense TaxID=34458 RepID=A0A5K1K5X4_9APHY|nr:Extracellular lipase (EC [Ganoderma boninense]
MVQDGQISFYTNAFSPHCHRVHIALEETMADYTLVTIDLLKKPEWYSLKVNPAGKIPAITYGGPKHPPNEPSPDATVLVESMVIVEFLAELFPSSRLLPRDPIHRARARILVSVADSKVVDGFRGFFFAGAPADALFALFEAVQALLPPAGFAVGDGWSIADIAAAPFLVRALMLLEHEIGTYPVGEGRKALEALRGSCSMWRT